MMPKHYHTSWNVEGCERVTDPGAFLSKREAIWCNMEQASHLAKVYKARKYGSGSHYRVSNGRALDTHFWVSGPCDCNERTI
jgi:hypothetical protein